MTGYFDAADKNSSVFVDGWLKTNDLGFVLSRELYVSGRLDDVIIIGGRNLFPNDIEAMVCNDVGLERSQFVVDKKRGSMAATN